jgi:hypothetical protein
VYELEHEFFLNLFATSLTTATTTVNHVQDTDLNTARLPVAAGAALATASTKPRHAPAAGRPPLAPRQRQHLATARSLIAAGARSAALATAIISSWPTCSASSAPGRRLLQLLHQVDVGRRAHAAGAPRCRRWPAPPPATILLLAGRPPAPDTRQHLTTAGSPIAADTRSAAAATAITSCWPTCYASSAPDRRLLQLLHQVDVGARSAASISCWPTCYARSAPDRRLLQLLHQVDVGRRARAAGAPRCRRWPAPRPGTHLRLAGRPRRRACANT